MNPYIQSDELMSLNNVLLLACFFNQENHLDA